jgi:hypothetical protein
MDWTIALWTGQWPYGLDKDLMDWVMALRTDLTEFVLVILNFALFIIWTKL